MAIPTSDDAAASTVSYGTSVTCPNGAGVGTVIGWDTTNQFALVLLGGVQYWFPVSSLS
jgi:hypothetical protein